MDGWFLIIQERRIDKGWYILTLKLHVIHAKEFVQMTPDGKCVFESTRDLMIEAVSEANASELEILLDFRNARADLTMADIYKSLPENPMLSGMGMNV